MTNFLNACKGLIQVPINTLTLKLQDHMSRKKIIVLTLIIKTLLMHLVSQLNNMSWMPKFKLYKWF